MTYNYREAMRNNIREYMEECVENFNEFDSESFDEIYNELWVTDSVTGNGSGSYTFSRCQAEEYVKDNLPLCIEAMEEFGYSAKEFGERVYNEEWEYLDVTIRCYLLGECLSEVLEEMGLEA